HVGWRGGSSSSLPIRFGNIVHPGLGDIRISPVLPTGGAPPSHDYYQLLELPAASGSGDPHGARAPHRPNDTQRLASKPFLYRRAYRRYRFAEPDHRFQHGPGGIQHQGRSAVACVRIRPHLHDRSPISNVTAAAYGLLPGTYYASLTIDWTTGSLTIP